MVNHTVLWENIGLQAVRDIRNGRRVVAISRAELLTAKNKAKIRGLNERIATHKRYISTAIRYFSDKDSLYGQLRDDGEDVIENLLAEPLSINVGEIIRNYDKKGITFDIRAGRVVNVGGIEV